MFTITSLGVWFVILPASCYKI